MKICLTNRCSSEYLTKVDEIKFKYKDRNTIIDYIGKYDATIILDCTETEEVDWETIEHLKALCRDNFIIAAIDEKHILECSKRKIKFYYNKPISTWEDLKAIANYNPEYVLIAAPLFFQLPEVNKYNIPVRAVPNLAYFYSFPKKNGIYGSWIRPEDLDMYDGLIATIEFYALEASIEQAYYRVYCEDKNWPFSLDTLICNFGEQSINNQYLPSSMTEARINCGQKCLRGEKCHICVRAAALSQNKKFQERLKYRDNEETFHGEYSEVRNES